MVRGCSAAVGNFTEFIHQPRRGEERRERLELVPLPLIPFGYTKTTKG